MKHFNIEIGLNSLNLLSNETNTISKFSILIALASNHSFAKVLATISFFLNGKISILAVVLCFKSNFLNSQVF